MNELIKKIAALLKAPEDLVQRSAEARAEASGKSTEEVLQSWSGGEVIEEAVEETVEETVEKAAASIPELANNISSTPPLKENFTYWALGIVLTSVFSLWITLWVPLSQVFTEANEEGDMVTVTSGAFIYNENGCQSCHSQNIRPLIPDAGIGKVSTIGIVAKGTNSSTFSNVGIRRLGPDLSNVGNRAPTNNKKWLIRYLKNPSSVRPTIPHPRYDYLTEEEISKLVDYLLTLNEGGNE